MIHYRSREGSSAIINRLSHQNGIRVPVFEELDRYIYKKNHKHSELMNVLSDVFSKGHYLHGFRKPNTIAPVDVDAPFQSVGFKWRIFGAKIQLARLFKRHRVKVFVLTRRDFAEIVASSYFHDVGLKNLSDTKTNAFPQFSVMSEMGSDGEKMREELSATTVSLNRFELFKCALIRMNMKWNQANSCLVFKIFSVPVKQIYYEDFLNDPEAFIANILKEIKIDSDAPISSISNFNRVYSNKHQERIENSSRGIDSLWFKTLKKLYDFSIWRVDHL